MLGLIIVQNRELLILDDYSMGLDAGYRQLFVDYIAEFFKDGNHTVILTSHVIQDMESFVDELVFLERGGGSLRTSMGDFTKRFRLYRLPRPAGTAYSPSSGGLIKNVEDHPAYWDIFSFSEEAQVAEELRCQGFSTEGIRREEVNLEDAFVGYTGRY